MTLLVNAYFYDDVGERKEIEFDLKPGTTELAGSESLRRNLYGSELAIELGLVFLPKLASQAILRVENTDLEALEIEVNKLMANSAGNSSNETRLNNILAAISLAKSHGKNGGVLIG